MNTQKHASQQDQDPKLACRNVWKVFGPHPKRFMAKHKYEPSPQDFLRSKYIGAVKNVDLEVYPGEIYVIMGLSGSGKSTVVRCMSRLHEPTSGAIIFEGQDLSKVNERELIELRRHKMGMVFQHFGLLPHRNVLENVAFPLEVQGVRRTEREKRAREVIELVGLHDRVHNFPPELSGGEQQRVGIARSLAVEPEVWFLDEPFSALDPLIRTEMQDEFLRLQRLLHKTIVFITHDFDEAIRLADRIAIMKDGEIVQIGTAEELITKPADDYVSDFTSKIPRSKVISVGEIMDGDSRPGDGAISSRTPTIHMSSCIDDCAQLVLTHRRPVCVVDDNGAVIGTLSRDKVLDILFANNGNDDGQDDDNSSGN